MSRRGGAARASRAPRHAVRPSVPSGGDEFDRTCWTNDTYIDAWMAAHGYSDLDQIVAYYYT